VKYSGLPVRNIDNKIIISCTIIKIENGKPKSLKIRVIIAIKAKKRVHHTKINALKLYR
jgi:hypothetical protein